MRAGFEYFRNFERDAQDFAQLAATRLAMPVLVLTGEKASGNFLIEQARWSRTMCEARLSWARDTGLWKKRPRR
jgi:hypothetical protein